MASNEFEKLNALTHLPVFSNHDEMVSEDVRPLSAFPKVELKFGCVSTLGVC